MVKVKSDRDLRILDDSCLNELYEICVVSVSSCALGNLKDNRALELACCFCDSLNDFHVVYVESTNSITAVISLLEHLSRCY